MKRTEGAMHQNNGINHIVDFIRENALAREIGSKLAITSKGELFLRELRESARQSNSDLSGAL